MQKPTRAGQPPRLSRGGILSDAVTQGDFIEAIGASSDDHVLPLHAAEDVGFSEVRLEQGQLPTREIVVVASGRSSKLLLVVLVDKGREGHRHQ